MKLSKNVKFIFICLLTFVVKTSKRCLFVSLVYSEGVLYTPGLVNFKHYRELLMSNKQEPYHCTCFDFFSPAENRCKGTFHWSRVPFALFLLEFHDFFHY